MPSLVSDFEIEEELAVFPGIERDPYYRDFVKTSSFLADSKRVVKGLEALEEQLMDKGRALWHQSAHFRDRWEFYNQEKLDPNRLESLLPGMLLLHFDRHSKKGFLKHLFSSTLTDLEVHEAFDISGHSVGRRAQYYLGPVDPELFRQQIEAGRPSGKDPFVDPGHGEYTHRLQWYAIMSRTSPLHLSHPAVEVYKRVGRYAAPEGAYQEAFRWGLWDALCDRDNGTAAVVPFKAVNGQDFRCPNALNTYLRTEGIHVGLPLISAFLNGRFEKRTEVRGNPVDYAARKVFGKGENALDERERGELESQLGSLRAVYDPRTGWR